MKLAELVLSENFRNIVLTGAGGSGKTSQLIALFGRLLEEGKTIPVFMQLNSFDDTKNYILNRFILDYTQCGYSADDNLKLVLKNFFLKNKKRTFVFILDAVNETSSDVTEYLYEDISFLAGFENVKLIVSLRYIPPFMKLFREYKLLPLEEEKLSRDIENYSVLSPEMKRLVALPMFYDIYIKSGETGKSDMTRDELTERYFEFALSKILDPQTGTSLSERYHYAVRRLLFDFMPRYVFEVLSSKKNYMLIDEGIIGAWEEYKRKYGIHTDKTCVKILKELGISEEISMKGALPLQKIKHEVYFDYFLHKAFENMLDEKAGASMKSFISDACRIITFYGEKGDKEQAYEYGKMLFEKLDNINSYDNKLRLLMAYGYAVCGNSLVSYDNETAKKALWISESIMKPYREYVVKYNDPEIAGYLVTLMGALANYAYEEGNEQLAKEMYEWNIQSYDRMLEITGDRDRWLLKIAESRKKTGRYYLKKIVAYTSFHGNWVLPDFFRDFAAAYDIYKEYSDGINRNLIECINGMNSCVIPLLRNSEIPEEMKEKYGDTPSEAAIRILDSSRHMLVYFSEELLLYDEIERCVENIESTLEAVRELKLAGKEFEERINGIRSFKSHNRYISERLGEMKVE